MKPGGGVILFLALALPAFAVRGESLPPSIMEASVTVEVQAGEPGSPRETMRVSCRRGAAATVTLERRPQGGAEQKASEAISDLEFRGIWEIVENQHLRQWLAEERDEEMSDFGEKALRIEWRSIGASAAQIHQVVWIRDLKNPGPFEVLKRALAKLAASRLARLPALYLCVGCV